eukprot:GHVL01010738.1.p1 GENE.GHVL01010738.1~~GHVL01010738.1.p1  ORF type:complete len:288 (+),score=46.85 GHVL01010738.1:60-923(+)
MVLLHVKGLSDSNQFLYETSLTTKVSDLLDELTEIHNMRLKTLRLSDACKGLAAYGPLRPEEMRGLSSGVAALSNLDVNSYGVPTNPDPNAYRYGVPPPPEIAEVLKRCADESAESVSHKLVETKQVLTTESVEDSYNKMRGAVMIAYPAYHKLPTWDPAYLILEGKENLDGTTDSKDVMDPTSACLWWAGKQFRNDKYLSDYVGKNEKTKIICRLVPQSCGAPVREPRIDTDTHKAMLAFCHKKNQDEKELVHDNDDSYLDAVWANPRGLKEALVGVPNNEVKWCR